MASFFNAEDALDPGHDLVGGWVGGLVQVDAAVAHVLPPRALQRGVSRGDGGVVASADVQAVIVLEEERPGGEAKTRRASVAPTTRRSGWREGAVARTVESLTVESLTGYS